MNISVGINVDIFCHIMACVMDIRVTLVNLDGRSGPAILPNDVPMRRLMAAIVHKTKLPRTAEDGTFLLYGLCRGDDEIIPDSLTLAQANVRPGEVLSLKVWHTNQPAFETVGEDDLAFEINILGSPISMPTMPAELIEHSLSPSVLPTLLKVLVVICLFVCGGSYMLARHSAMTAHEDMFNVTVEPPLPTRRPYTAVSSSLYNFDLTRIKGLMEPDNLLAFEGRVYFTAVNPETDSVELWRTNGTITNTRQVSHFNEPGRGITELTVVGDRFFFLRDDVDFGKELWASDGSVVRTYLVKDIRFGEMGSSPTELTVVGDLLFFSATDGEHGEELWRSDGTAAGTFMVADIHPTAAARPENLTAVGNQLFFTATDNNGCHQLWVSDGSVNNTVMVHEISCNGEDIGNVQLTTWRDTLYLFKLANVEIDYSEPQEFSYPVTSIVNDVEITFQFKVIPRQEPNITTIIETEHGLFYTTEDGVLWFYSSENDLRQMNNSDVSNFAQPRELFATDNLLYFVATSEQFGEELWRSDGTAEGTYMVKDIDPTGVSHPVAAAFVNGLYFFMADDGRFGRELWVTDGSPQGTLMVSDLTAGKRGSSVDSLVELDGDIYFVQSGGGNARQLWRLAWND